MVKVTFTGTDAALAFLAKAPEAVRKGVAKALKEAATITKQEAVRFCPVDTGFLRSSLYYKTEGPLSYSVGAKAGYSGYVEYGTRYMKAKPYIRPAFLIVHQTMKPDIVERIYEEIRRIRQ